jgi:hypothetical protein
MVDMDALLAPIPTFPRKRGKELEFPPPRAGEGQGGGERRKNTLYCSKLVNYKFNSLSPKYHIYLRYKTIEKIIKYICI